MSYWGKVVGALAGLATGRPWMAIIGVILGHQFDRGFADKFTKFGPDVSARRLEHVSPRFVQILFETLGHIAKADGRVSEDEIRAARSLMNRLSLGPVEIREAVRHFETGKHVDYPIQARMRELRAKEARKQDARGLFLRLVMELVLANGTIHERERALLWVICTELDVGRVELAQLEAMLRAQRGFRRSAAGSEDSKRVDAAYRTLGVDRTASNDEVKTAYRRLMNKSHPDKLSGGDHDPDAVSEAERRTREVRTAYELLKARRSIR